MKTEAEDSNPVKKKPSILHLLNYETVIMTTHIFTSSLILATLPSAVAFIGPLEMAPRAGPSQARLRCVTFPRRDHENRTILNSEVSEPRPVTMEADAFSYLLVSTGFSPPDPKSRSRLRLSPS